MGYLITAEHMAAVEIVHYFLPKSAFPHNTGERNLKQLRPDMAIVPMVAGQ